ncbi:amino acid ABC transporter permease [Devosia pacifica]|uniref:Amino acid ABC transporter permease n=1 Tax=Devosia pacifica TaxID=1335967 RepID=A0A918SFK6_9HYPH|nr:sugar ABC transporter permease [Devosia pacifica]GHA36206.1 amino acid ABC transporter permease [Devosia pacifica]
MRHQGNPWLTSNLFVLGIGILPALLMIGVLLYFTAWAFAFSFTDLALVGRKSVEWSWVGFDNFERLFTRRGFLESLWTTIYFVFFSAIVGQSLLGFILAASLRGMRGTLRTMIEVSIMLGWLVPDIVAAFLWSATTSDTGLINALIVVPLGFQPVNFINDYALAVVTIANIWKGTAWSYILFSAALDSISRELIEAAKVDGATMWQRVSLVILPIIRPHIATNMLFITIWTFTYFPLIFAMTGGGPGRQTETLAIFLYNQSFSRGNLGFGSAISVAMLLIVGGLSLIYLRMLREPT